MHGVAPHMCVKQARPLLDRGVGGRSPGFLFSAAIAAALATPAGHCPTRPNGNGTVRSGGRTAELMKGGRLAMRIKTPMLAIFAAFTLTGSALAQDLGPQVKKLADGVY